jgi:hypothetical protein
MRSFIKISIIFLVIFCGCGSSSDPIPVGTRSEFFPVGEGFHFRYQSFFTNGSVRSEKLVSFQKVEGNKVTLNGPTSLFGGYSEFEFSDSTLLIGPEKFDMMRFPLQHGNIYTGSPQWEGENLTRTVSYLDEFLVFDYVNPQGVNIWVRHVQVYLISTEPTDIKTMPIRIWIARYYGIIAFEIVDDGMYYLQEDE